MTAAQRMALQYVLLFGGSGVSLPFAGLWFQSLGLNGAEIGILLAAPMLGRVVTGPVLAIWADGFRWRRTPLAILGLAMTVGYGGAALVDGFLAWAALWFIGATAAAALIPLTDVLTMRLAERHGFSFSVPRGYGSLAFVLANVGMGALLLQGETVVIVVWLVACALGVAVFSALLLPAEPVVDDEADRHGQRFQGLTGLLRNPVFMLSILAVGLVQASHAFHYGFSALVWKEQGIGAETTGALWAFGVVVEIGLMWFAEPWRRRIGIGPWQLLILGGAAGVLRWSVMAFAPPLPWLWPLQALHALSFAATFLAGVQIVERLAPRNDQSAAQTLQSVLSAGILIGLATAASGLLFDRFGAGGYGPMALMAAAGMMLSLVLSLTRPRPVQ